MFPTSIVCAKIVKLFYKRLKRIITGVAPRGECGPSRHPANSQTYKGMSADAKSNVKKLIDENPVMIFSKTYCPYCVKVVLKAYCRI